MYLSGQVRERIKQEIVASLSEFPEIRRIVVFGSFVNSDTPRDLDIAIFQDSAEGYYPLAMKYRQKLRTVANKIPLDVIPLRRSPQNDPFIQEIQGGEVLYER